MRFWKEKLVNSSNHISIYSYLVGVINVRSNGLAYRYLPKISLSFKNLVSLTAYQDQRNYVFGFVPINFNFISPVWIYTL